MSCIFRLNARLLSQINQALNGHCLCSLNSIPNRIARACECLALNTRLANGFLCKDQPRPINFLGFSSSPRPLYDYDRGLFFFYCALLFFSLASLVSPKGHTRTREDVRAPRSLSVDKNQFSELSSLFACKQCVLIFGFWFRLTSPHGG